MPGDTNYDEKRGIKWVIEKAYADMLALQEGGVDGIIFSNERSQPWTTKVKPVISATMARIIGEIKGELRIPFGVDVIWDAMASIDLAVATGAFYVREVFTGAYASDYGIWDTNLGETLRHRRILNGENIRLLFNITPEAAAYMGPRTLGEITKTTIFNGNPDGLCVSGTTAGEMTPLEDLKTVRAMCGNVSLFANTGVNAENVTEQLRIANGAVVGSAFKKDGRIWNDVDVNNVKELMQIVRSFRKD
jgi:membrane complex biogenesis BtpA family protein